MKDFDVIVVGAGSGGLTVSIGLAGAGKKVALVEKGPIGGDCTNFGCVPSKALIDIAASGKYNSVKEALEEVRARRKKIQDEETPEEIEKHGIKVFKGKASLVSKNIIQIGDKKQISAKNIVISTGSGPVIYPIEGLNKKDILTNETIFEQKENIKNLVVIGGGYIGCEMAESFASIGVNVTIIQRNLRLIPREEKESSEVIEKSFRSKNIKIFTNSNIEKADDEHIFIKDKTTGNITKIPYDKVLVALGRSANISSLDLDRVGIKHEKRGISVDKYNRTNVKNIYAIGDCVNGNPQFTHLANNEGRGVIRNILVPFFKTSVRNFVLPATLYTQNEVARIGKTYEELMEIYTKGDIRSDILYFDHNDRSKLTKNTYGFVKINFRRVSGKILGATIAGKGAGEMLPVLTSAMQNNTSAYKLSKLIFAYPTKSELIKKVSDKFVVGTLSNIKSEIKYYLKDNALQIVTATIWITIVGFFIYYKNKYNLSLEEIAFSIYNFIRSNPSFGPLAYILLYAVRPVVLFPATFMTFMSGALFGFAGGLAFTLIGENLSAMFAYLLGNIFGKKIVGRAGGGAGLIRELKSKVNEKPFTTILMTRLLFFPFDLVNYTSGFLRVRFKAFVLATFIGIIPGASVFILAGASFYNNGKELTSFSDAISDIDVKMLYFAAILFIATIVFAKYLKRRNNNKINK